ncbi:MAG TPA: type II toxin-antitoxin system HicB family antitoxin [Terracidiphilus sp.]|jgi:predicted HicB family RNase H-like nuclease|nr:type II toxin-antitoxin system HicB family antitoxin [Terracidiphilus sp.]
MMEYKGYVAGPIDFDAGENSFSGTVAGLRDVIHFEGSTARELTRAFRESIDSYLELCAETGQEPDRPFSGKILVRTEPALHREVALRAAAEGVSLNQWIARQLEARLRESA